HLLHSPITDPAPPLIYTLSLHDALPILPILESFVTKYPGHKQVPDAQYLLGWARVKSGDSKAGLADLRAFVAAAPNHELAPAARRMITETLARSGDRSEMQDAYKALMEQTPPTP